MIQPYITGPDWTYISVDGLIWLSSGLKLPTNLEEKACESIIEIYKTIDIGQPLVVDFRNIIDVADRALETLFQTFQINTREAILVNYEYISDKIDRSTNEHYYKPTQSICQDGGICYKLINHISLAGEVVLNTIDGIRSKKVKDFVFGCFEQFETSRYLKSTPIKATGAYDAAKLISSHTSFYWICLELSEKLKGLINAGKVTLNKDKEIRLLSVNLKSCPFASVVSLLTKIPLVTIDHMGPKNKVYDLDILDDLENLKKYTYIYLGDFCIGGTEIKVAKAYASISDSELNTALVIGSYLPQEAFQPAFDLYSLVDINNFHPHAKFEL